MAIHELGNAVWVELDDPSPEELASLLTRFSLPRFAVDVAAHGHHRPRFETYDGYDLLVLRPAMYRDPDEVVEIGQLSVIVGPEVVVSITRHAPWLSDEMRRAFDPAPEPSTLDPPGALDRMVEMVVEGYSAVLEGLDRDVDEIETQVFSEARGSHAERIYRLKSEVQEFRRATGPLPDELDRARTSEAVARSSAVDDHLREVRAKAVRAAEHVTNLDELLNSALSAHLAQIGVQQNNDMRRISAWVAIVAAPTAMAGIYGMNFRFMPELEWRYGYFVVLAVMATVCSILFRSFKRSGWL